jgi:hypothetical protein
MSDLRDDLASALVGVTKGWKKAKDGQDRIRNSRLREARSGRYYRHSIRDAAFEVMELAYNHASSGGRYYVRARQIMYAARPMVLKMTNGECWKNSSYFTQTLLKDYIECTPHASGWNLVWDARGHFHEPHTGHGVDLGGVAVTGYLQKWTNGKFETMPEATIKARVETKGPGLRFRAALFIEKEGFDEILRAAGVAERYDLAIFSSKGVPVKAACDMAQALEREGVKILVAHDFDLAGFKILRTMRNGTRLNYGGADVTDIGLRLADVQEMDLESEPVSYSQETDPRTYLRRCGATTGEANFLVEAGGWGRGWSGQRVELNAMTSEQLIDWLERKLEENGVEKVVPTEEVLGEAYKRAVFRRALEVAATEVAKELPTIEVPAGLEERVREYLEENPTESWDEAVVAILDESEEGEP